MSRITATADCPFDHDSLCQIDPHAQSEKGNRRMNAAGDLGRELRAARELHKFDNIVLAVIDAVDLAVSKAARFGTRDREDIRALARLGLVDMEIFANRAEEALSCYVGDMTFVRCNLADAREMIEKAGARTFLPDNAVPRDSVK